MPLPPGPRLPRLLQAVAFVRDPVGFLERSRARYGDCFTASFPLVGTVVYIADPGEVKRVFSGPVDLFHAGEANAEMFGPVVGENSLLTLDEDAHMRQRKLLSPPFHGEGIRRFEQTFAEVAAREVERWPVGTPFRLLPAMQRITLEVILRAVLGLRDPADLESFTRAVLRLDAIAGRLLPMPALQRDLGRLSPWGRFLAARADLDALVYAEIERRRIEESERQDVLSLLIAARHEDGTPMSDLELRDEILTLIAAGYGTSSTSLAWAFERVLRTPPVLERLMDSPPDEYLNAVVNETLRVRPPITDSTRVLTADTEIAGHRLPAGTQVLIPLPLLHLRPESHADPHEFRPERFLGAKPEPFTFIPFGGGVRRCVGASFAQVEMRVVLRTVLERARLRATSPQPEKQRLHHVAVFPHRGARVELVERLTPPHRPAGREPELAAA